MTESIIVFSGRNINEMRKERGSSRWKMSKTRANRLEYIIISRCLTQEYATSDYEHGTAFLIGKVTGSHSVGDGRICVEFNEYADIHVPNAWKLTGGRQNPVHYFKTNELLDLLNIKPNKLNWKTFN